MNDPVVLSTLAAAFIGSVAGFLFTQYSDWRKFKFDLESVHNLCEYRVLLGRLRPKSTRFIENTPILVSI